MDTLHLNREAWLGAAVEELRPVFAAQGHTLPAAIAVTCGFPSTASRSGAIGQCWSAAASSGGTVEVLISPELADPSRVFDVLIHELAHSAPGCFSHGVTFQRLCSAMLLIPAASSWTATVAGPAFKAAYSPIIDSLGAYPHTTLSMSKRKVQTTRMLKLICPTCGYTIRTSAKWLALGIPTCHDGDTFNVVSGK